MLGGLGHVFLTELIDTAEAHGDVRIAQPSSCDSRKACFTFGPAVEHGVYLLQAFQQALALLRRRGIAIGISASISR